ncbi:MAG: bacteriohemerythrin, partial [Syntrophomonas sp.]
MITWREEFRIGENSIDEQHMQLFSIAGRAFDLLKDDLRTDKYDEIVAILEELKNYTVYHFKFEEEYMVRIGYGKFLSHKVLHDDFIEKINSIDIDKIDDNQGEYLMGILDFVVKWIEGHILGQDKKYAA